MYKKLHCSAQAGFDEKNDLLVNVAPGQDGSGIVVNLKSSVMRHYGDHIRELIIETAKQCIFKDVIIDVKDNGAWDYTIKARVTAALERGMKYEC